MNDGAFSLVGTITALGEAFANVALSAYQAGHRDGWNAAHTTNTDTSPTE